MNAQVPAKPKRSHHKKKPAVLAEPVSKPKLPNLDPNDPVVWQEAARQALEGNGKLQRGCDLLRKTLQTIMVAEMDMQTKLPVTAKELRALAAEGLSEFGALTGQDWRSPRNRVVETRVGDRNQATLEGDGYG
jgi:hypothetical protein